MKCVKAILAVLVVLGVVMGFIGCAWAEQYNNEMIVFGLDYMRDKVYFEDDNGMLWACNGVQGWKIGCYVNVTMDDVNTKTIYDDEIIDVKLIED